MENLMALVGHAGALALSVSFSAALVRLCLHGAFSLLPTANEGTRFVVPEAAKGLPPAYKAGLDR